MNYWWQFIKNQLSDAKTQAILAALAGAYLLFPGFYDSGVWAVSSISPFHSLDPSWQVALSKAYATKLNWGNDIVFTYGPLSFFSTRIGIGTGKYTLLLFDLFMAFNFFMVFYYRIIKSQNRLFTLFIIGASIFVMPSFFGSGISIAMMALLVFWLSHGLEKKSHLSNCMITAICVLLFFIKFNTGLICLVLASCFCIYRLFQKNSPRLFYVFYLIAPYLLICFLCPLLNVSLVSYLIGGLSIVSGYNDVMYLNQDYGQELFFALSVLALSVMVLVSKLSREREQLPSYLFRVFVFGSCAFILFKQAFTRNDIHHITEFYAYYLILLLCSGLFHPETLNKNISWMVSAIIFVVIFYAKKRNDDMLSDLEQRFYKKDYLSRLKNYSDSSGVYYHHGENQLPDRMKTRIGSSRIDAYPWNISLLLENRLNFQPRPVFQSYSAYNVYLQKLNYDSYNSSRAPKFVMYEFETIDQRYPLFEEPRLNLKLLKDYSCVDTFYYGNRPMLLLERKNMADKALRFEKIQEYELNIEDGIVPQKDSYYEVHIKPLFKAKLISFFWHSPEIKLQINTANGEWFEHKTTKNLLECGVFSPYYVKSTAEFLNLLNNDSLDAGKRVNLYKFTPLNKALFDSKAKVIEYKIIR